MSERMSDARATALFERLRIVARGESSLPESSAQAIIEDWSRARAAEAAKRNAERARADLAEQAQQAYAAKNAKLAEDLAAEHAEVIRLRLDVKAERARTEMVESVMAELREENARLASGGLRGASVVHAEGRLAEVERARDYRVDECTRLAARVRELVAERDAALAEVNCGQEGVCAKPPGCARHWQERNQELAAEVAKLKERSEGLQQAGADLTRLLGLEKERDEALASSRAWCEKAAELQAERDEALAWQESVAEGLGYLNRADGLAGYQVATPEVILEAIKAELAERDAACEFRKEAYREAARRLRTELARTLDRLELTREGSGDVERERDRAAEDLANAITSKAEMGGRLTRERDGYREAARRLKLHAYQMHLKEVLRRMAWAASVREG